jgi:Aminopeptidase N
MVENFPAFYTPTTPAGFMLSVHNDVLSQPNGSVFVPDASIYDENRIFSFRLSYEKGSAIIHNLRFEMQNDNLFFQTLKNYQQIFKDSVATANDFKSVAEVTSGKNFTDFFNQWYYGEGYPTFNVDYSKQGNEIVLFVNQVASAPTVTPFFKGLYEFTINTTQGDTTVKVNQTVNNQFFRFTSNRTPTGVVVDPNNWVLNKVGSITTGINDPINVSNNVILYPNPSKGNMVLKYPLNWFDEMTFFDETGRKIFIETVPRGTTQRTINTKLLPGVYLLRLEGKGKLAVKKVIITD